MCGILRPYPGDGQSALQGVGQETGFQTDLLCVWRHPEPGALLGKAQDSSEPPALAGSESGGPSLARCWLLPCFPPKPPGETGVPTPTYNGASPPPLQVEKSLQRIQNGQRNAMYTSQQSVENKVGGIPGWQALLTAVGFRLDPPASGLPAAVFFPTSDPGERLQQCSSTIQSLLGELRPAARAGWGPWSPLALDREDPGSPESPTDSSRPGASLCDPQLCPLLTAAAPFRRQLRARQSPVAEPGMTRSQGSPSCIVWWGVMLPE